MNEHDQIGAAIDEGRVPLGMWCFSGSAPLLEIMGHTGFDFVVIDTEHTCIDSAQVEQLVRTCETVNLMPLVRVAENSQTLIRRALEAGAEGIVVPQVKSVADVEAAVSATRYPPSGSRGGCPSTRAARYTVKDWGSYIERANRSVRLIPLLEDLEAIENAEDICSIAGVDTIMFGPGDLAIAMGHGADAMLRPEVQEAFDRVVQASKKTNTMLIGVPFPDWSIAACKTLVNRGANAIIHSVDELFFFESCRQLVAQLREELDSPSVHVSASEFLSK